MKKSIFTLFISLAALSAYSQGGTSTVVSLPTLDSLTHYAGTALFVQVRDTVTGGPFILSDKTRTGTGAFNLTIDNIRVFPKYLDTTKVWVRPGHDIDIRMAGAKASYFDIYGAHLTDNTTAINSCIQAMAAVGGGRVHIPAGYFGIKSLVLADKVILYGDDYPNSILMKAFGTDTSAMIKMTAAGEAFGINGVRIMGNTSDTSHYNGIDIDQTSSMTSGSVTMPQLENVMLQNIPGIGLKMKGVIGLMATRIRMDRTDKGGVYMAACTDNRFDVLSVQQASYTGGNYCGVYLDGASANNEFTNLKIGTGGATTDTANNGMWIQGPRNMIAAANFQANHGAGLKISGSLANSNTITDVVADGNLKYGVLIDNTGGNCFGNNLSGINVYSTTTKPAIFHTLYGFYFINKPAYTSVQGVAYGDSLLDVSGVTGATHTLLDSTGKMNIITKDNTGRLTNVTFGLTANFANVTIPATTTQYFTPTGTPTGSSTSNNTNIICPASGYLGNLIVNTLSTQPSSGNLTVTVRRSGTDTGLSVTITAGATFGQFTNLTPVHVNPGELLTLTVANGASAASAQIRAVSFNITN